MNLREKGSLVSPGESRPYSVYPKEKYIDGDSWWVSTLTKRFE